MSRRIILCFDGTNNLYAANNTNVVKLYAMIDKSQNDQLAYYHTGIGTLAPPGIWGKFKRWLVTRLDLAIAWSLKDHVSEGYRYLMRYYQTGDQIFIFGFSRGAYTARVLAGMLHKVGLLTQGNEELIPFAWDSYKNEKDRSLYTGFQNTFCRKARIHFLGLWDTVSSVGWAWHPQHLQYTANNPSVDAVRHAIALDERRAYFVQNLWGHDPSIPTDILQVWFPGVHCDIGGGYIEREAGLSKIALRWIVDQAKLFGLRIDPKTELEIIPIQNTARYVAPSPDATQHESLHGWWWIAEFVPKRIKDPAANYAPKWILRWGRPRFVVSGANVHASVLTRRQLVPDYQPKNVPLRFEPIP